MLWINFLHLYQPAVEDDFIIKEAADKSYVRIVAALEKNPRIKFTLNIAGCLLERLEAIGYIGLILRIKKLIKKGQIELVGSAAYHPILPLVPIEEAELQIEENEKILKKYFGKIKLNGFFLPEMAYSSDVAKLVKSLGYKWLILDEISADTKIKIDFSQIYFHKQSGLKIIFRSRDYSSNYTPIFLAKKIKEEFKETIITAHDGELYGLRYIDPTKKFEKILKKKKLKTNTISGYIKQFRNSENIKLRASSWESKPEELRADLPYALWQNKNNKIQNKIWELSDLAYKTYKKYPNDKNIEWSRWRLVRGLASCTFWWASAKDFRHVYGPYAWNPDFIERGIGDLIRSIRSLDDYTTREIKIKSEKLYIKIKKMIWEKHWRYYWKK